jgi:hypothetical protein
VGVLQCFRDTIDDELSLSLFKSLFLLISFNYFKFLEIYFDLKFCKQKISWQGDDGQFRKYVLMPRDGE